ncbi:hypothetical protein H6P81_012455 [Aristolochia fimbriata]|uniref:Reverse transcriptase domain-containing protein n=1 Tax=Aristolochia fimbriata TaxID=158543 RepID=A0AAV7EF43_ARIFI|nr:hypothetical protein H6P81_012455 [Aristolochia fimbriata]
MARRRWRLHHTNAKRSKGKDHRISDGPGRSTRGPSRQKKDTDAPSRKRMHHPAWSTPPPASLMKLLSWNIRGLGGPKKRANIKEVLRQEGVGLFVLQETKQSQILDPDVRSVACFPDPQWKTVDAIEIAGGILIAWNPTEVEVMEDEVGAFCLGIRLKDRSTGNIWCLGGIYGPSSHEGRAQFWEELDDLLHRWDDPRQMRTFNDFMDAFSLDEVSTTGKRFTWSNNQAQPVLSKPDRILANPEWLRTYPDCSGKVTSKVISDHWPIIFDTKVAAWGKPFRFKNHWLAEESFKAKLEAWWAELQYPGPKGSLAAVKLKKLKARIVEWVKMERAKATIEKRMLNIHIRGLDEMEEDRALSPTERSDRQIYGPDGFNGEFYRAAWDFMKNDIVSLLEDFYHNGIKHRSIGLSIIKLVPKKEGAENVRDYRPISLISGLYKIIARVLASRLKKVSASIISLQQSAFIKSRQILDAAMFIHEATHWFKKERKSAFILKLDLEKAFDRVNWKYLDQIMKKMNFGNKWRSWIKSCLASARFSIAVNGGLFVYFTSSRGVRQGDPLSPLLFNIAAEGLAAFFEQLMHIGWLENPLPENELPMVQFTDDTVIFCQGKIEQVIRLKAALYLLEHTSGQKVNWSKSKLLGINIPGRLMEEAAEALGCSIGELPMTQLGLPLFEGQIGKHLWDPVIERLNRRLTAWKGKHLSKAGRLVLLKSSLMGIPTFLLSFLHCPKAMVRNMESVMKKFLWRGAIEEFKFHQVGWREVCQAKKTGGLGIRNISDFNKALLQKWCWHINEERHSPRRLSPIWRNLYKIFCSFEQKIRILPGKGDRTSFWDDLWIGDTTLKAKFPQLFTQLRDQEAVEVAEMDRLISTARLDQNQEDKMLWIPTTEGRFTVKTTYEALANSNASDTHPSYLAWTLKGPPKAQFLLWVALHKKMLTRENLSRRGMTLQTTLCPVCGLTTETVDHITLHCSNSWNIWMALTEMFGFHFCAPHSLHDFIIQWRAMYSGTKRWMMAEATTTIVAWCIWEERNKRVFLTRSSDWKLILKNIITKVIEWLRTRKEFAGISGSQLRSNWSQTTLLSTSRKTKQNQEWQAPRPGRIKLNTDRSSMGNPGLAGIDGLFCDHNGNILLTYCGPIGIADSTEAETRAILEGIRLFRSHLTGMLEIEGDSQNVIQWCKRQKDPPWRLISQFREIWANSTTILS